MQSIPRKDSASLPDFCNLGVALRILLIGNLALLLGALAAAQPFSPELWVERVLVGAALMEPVLIASLVVLCPIRRLLYRLAYWQGVALVMLVEIVLTVGFGWVLRPSADVAETSLIARDGLLAALLTGLALYYFRLRQRAFSDRKSVV